MALFVYAKEDLLAYEENGEPQLKEIGTMTH
jgi:hypothetical protein